MYKRPIMPAMALWLCSAVGLSAQGAPFFDPDLIECNSIVNATRVFNQAFDGTTEIGQESARLLPDGSMINVALQLRLLDETQCDPALMEQVGDMAIAQLTDYIGPLVDARQNGDLDALRAAWPAHVQRLQCVTILRDEDFERAQNADIPDDLTCPEVAQ